MRLTEILFDALELRDEARRRYLDRACGDDVAMRAEIETLLASDDATGFSRFLSQPALDGVTSGSSKGVDPRSVATRVDIPEQIGPFRIVRELGFGGMGTVYLAEQTEPIERRVAVKVVHALHHVRWRDRFTAECQALARLNHPHIAALYEVGTTVADSGRALPYVAMEFVDGRPVDAWCDAQRVTLERRLQLFVDVCSGVSHAHRHGILHCDLKPANVLVAEDEGLAKLIDFGIARAVDDPEHGTRSTTQEMSFGSPPYISPELIRRDGAQRLDTRTDVYALGLILYRLLVGVLPFRESSTWLLMLQITEKEPTLPSSRFAGLDADDRTAIAATRGMEPAALIEQCRGNLDAIVTKAIDRDPDRRYGSPAELAADIERHLADEPILARTPTPGDLLARFVRRHAPWVVAAVLLILALAGGFVARSVEARRANAEAARATAEAQRANEALAESEEIHRFVLGLFQTANPERAAGESPTVRDVLDQGTERLRSDLAERPRLRASLLQTVGSIHTVLGNFATAAELVDEALTIRRAVFDPGDPAILESQSELGVILRRLGRYEDAVPLLVDVLEARKADPDTDPELLARAYNHLGLAYWRLLRYDDAERALRQSWRLRDAAGHPAALAETANNLAVLLQSRQRNREALPLLEQALALFEQELGAEHPRVASVLSNLASTHEKLDTWPQAEPLLRRAIVLSEASFGRHHFQPLNPRINLVQVLRLQHRHDEAFDEAQRILEVAEILANPLVLARALYTMGRLEMELERPADAEARFGRCERLVGTELGLEHLQARKCRVWRARALVFSGQVDAGLARLHELAARYARDLPRHHRDRRDVTFTLGVVASRAGDFTEAVRYYTDHLDALSEITPTRHRALANGRHALGVALAAANDPRAAETLRQALEGRIRQYGAEHPWVADGAFALGQLERARENADAACAWFEQASAIRRAWFRSDDPDRLAAEEASAACSAG